MIRFTAQDIADATGGILHADPKVEVTAGATTDSRDVSEGYLFIAKPGEKVDGHDYIPVALSAGATLILAERLTQHDEKDVPAVIVKDVVLAMGKIAQAMVVRLHRDYGTRVVGITGSAGKTTTKDLLAAMLSTAGNTVAPIGSYNGEVGVPLTVFRATENTEFLVVEMGADHVGNIRYLCDLVEPDIAVVLCVGTAHAGEFGGVKNIAITKREMVEGLSSEHRAILNYDDAKVREMRSHTVAPITWFSAHGMHNEADTVYATDTTLDDFSYPHFDVHFPDGTQHHVDGTLIGVHHVNNMLAAAAVAYNLGITIENIAAVLNQKNTMSKWRMQREEHPAGFTVINDAYNANPESMKAALQTLAHVGRGKRTWAVLGEMRELGEESFEKHREVGTQVVRLNICKVLVVGAGAKAIFNAAILEGSWGSEAHYAETFEEAKKILCSELLPEDVVLFKSSNGAGLGFLAEEILECPATEFNF